MPKLVSKPLSELAVRKAKPRAARYDLYDGMLRGLGLRVATSGTKSWFVMRRVNNRNTRYTIGRYPEVSLSEARIEAVVLLGKMSKGETPREMSSDTFENVLEEWFQRDQSSNKSIRQVRSALSYHAIPVFKGRSIASISKKDLLRLIDQISDSGAKTQANRVLAFLRRFFNWCVERDLLTSNPTTGIKRSPETSRDRVLSLDELGILMAAATEIGYPFGPLFKVLVLTGQRLKEVAEASWSEIDFARKEWLIPSSRTKNGRQNVVHLSDSVVDILLSLPRVDGQDWLFSTIGARPVSGYSKAKVRFDRFTGIQNWTFHDLRRSFATHATEKLEINPAVVDKIQNHISGTVKGVAAVYQRGEYLDQRRAALDAWAKYVSALG